MLLRGTKLVENNKLFDYMHTFSVTHIFVEYISVFLIWLPGEIASGYPISRKSLIFMAAGFNHCPYILSLPAGFPATLHDIDVL